MRRSLEPDGRSNKKLTVAWHFVQANGNRAKEKECAGCDRKQCKSKPWVRHYSWNKSKEDGGGIGQVAVKSSRINECPVSYVTPESLALLEMVQGSRMAHKVTGACLFGSDTAKWPAVYFDAVRTIHAAEVEEEKLVSKYGR